MKLTKSKLKKIIKEELQTLLNEQPNITYTDDPSMAPPKYTPAVRTARIAPPRKIDPNWDPHQYNPDSGDAFERDRALKAQQSWHGPGKAIWSPRRHHETKDTGGWIFPSTPAGDEAKKHYLKKWEKDAWMDLVAESQLQHIINEELTNLLNEKEDPSPWVEGWPSFEEVQNMPLSPLSPEEEAYWPVLDPYERNEPAVPAYTPPPTPPTTPTKIFDTSSMTPQERRHHGSHINPWTPGMIPGDPVSWLPLKLPVTESLKK